MKKVYKIIILNLLVSLLLNHQFVVFAQEDNLQDSSPSATATDSATNNLKERIEKIVEEKKDDIESVLQEKTNKKHGFVGEVSRVTKETIAVETNQGNKIIPVDENLLLIKKKQVITVTDIAVGNWVTIIGIVEDDAFIPKRLIVSSSSLSPKNKQITLGTIKSLTKTSISIQSRADQTEQAFSLSKKTAVEDMNKQKLSLNLLTKDIQCLIVGFKNEDDKNPAASTIHVLTTTEVLEDEDEEN